MLFWTWTAEMAPVVPPAVLLMPAHDSTNGLVESLGNTGLPTPGVVELFGNPPPVGSAFTRIACDAPVVFELMFVVLT